MHSAVHPLRAGLLPLTCLLLLGLPRPAQAAEDEPSSPAEPPPAAAPSASAEPPSAEPPAAAPAAPDEPAQAPTPVPAPPPASAGSGTKPAGAAFAPLPEPPRGSAKSKAPKPLPEGERAAPLSESPAAPPAGYDSPPPGTSPDARANEADSHEDSGGLFGPFRLGLLAGGGLPDLVSLGGQLKLTRFFGVGVNIGLIPTVKISYYGDATLAYQEYDAYAHLYPFGGAFFLGAGVGYEAVRGTVSSSYDLRPLKVQCAVAALCAQIPDSAPIDSQASVRTLVLTPQIGFLKIFGSGFALGVDIGAQIPIAPSKVDFATTVPSYVPQIFRDQYITPNDQKVRATLDKIGRTPLPTFNLKIGWFL